MKFKQYKRKKEASIIKAIQMKVEFEVSTLEGTMKGRAGDYLAKDVDGNFYVIDKKIFQKTYQQV